MKKPDYSGRSIVNLMSSISSSCGVPSAYPDLRTSYLSDLEDSDNIVLLIVDGLGYNYLKKSGADTYLARFLRDKMDSVFLSSTGSAVTTFFTATAPQQHAVTGWYVYLHEFGIVTRYLPFTNVADNHPLGIEISDTLDTSPLLPKLNRAAFSIQENSIVDSVYSQFMAGSATRVGYDGLEDFFEKLRQAVSQPGKSYVHAYWPELDAIGHMLGMADIAAANHLHTFDRSLQTFAEEIEGTSTTLIVTGDHGFNDVLPDNLESTLAHPRLLDCLTLPLCGDTRTSFCFVRPSMVNPFERYVSAAFGEYCTLLKSQDLLDTGWFGLGDMSPRLQRRVGDYTLIFGKGHALVNAFPGIQPHALRGHHGGVSSDEMYVPLIIMKL
jgi:hypothetical protein